MGYSDEMEQKPYGENEEDWSPEKEKRDDPARFQREMMEFARKQMDELRSMMNARKNRLVGGSPEPILLEPVPLGQLLDIRIRLIKNGLIVSYLESRTDPCGLEHRNWVEAFAAGDAELIPVVLEAVRCLRAISGRQ